MMIFMQDKKTNKIYENIGCDAFGPKVILKDKEGNTFDANENNYECIFKSNPKYQACLDFWTNKV